MTTYNNDSEIIQIIRLFINGYGHFLNDDEKMTDYWKLSKAKFLESYSYLTEEEYELTRKLMRNKDIIKKKGGNMKY